MWPSGVAGLFSVLASTVLPESCLICSTGLLAWAAGPGAPTILAAAASLALAAPTTITTTLDDCRSSYDAANQVAESYPDSATGVLNSTVAMLPIPMSVIQRTLPEGLRVLETLLRRDLPQLADAGLYPVILVAAHDHDIKLAALNLSIPDFSRIGLEFPYLDLRGDGTPFKWAPRQLISAHNSAAMEGSVQYGTTVFPSKFYPACEAYALGDFNGEHRDAYIMRATAQAGPATPHGDPESSNTINTNTNNNENNSINANPAMIETIFYRQTSPPPPPPPPPKAAGDRSDPLVANSPQTPEPVFTVEAMKRIFAQTTFAAVDSTCDRFRRLWDSPTMDTTIVPVSGRVVLVGRANPLMVGDENRWTVFTGVKGFQVATPFAEDNYLDCATA